MNNESDEGKLFYDFTKSETCTKSFEENLKILSFSWSASYEIDINH